jgi:hypothetical protein
MIPSPLQRCFAISFGGFGEVNFEADRSIPIIKVKVNNLKMLKNERLECIAEVFILLVFLCLFR